MRWTVVIPVKALPAAKSRLREASADDASHRQLVEAIRADTAAAAASAGGVARVLLVADRAVDTDRIKALTVVQHSPGLNGALVDAAEHARRQWPDDGVAALVGDLAALRSEHLASALNAATRHRRAFAADSAGTGTTLLTALPGIALSPSFGPGSAARHARTAYPLEAGDTVRADVDAPADLAAARLLGVGPATARVLAARDAGMHADRLDVG